jgi:hypothetical protein
LVVKFLLIRIAGKGEMRTAFSWVGIPITGLWDAFTLYKVAREARSGCLAMYWLSILLPIF